MKRFSSAWRSLSIFTAMSLIVGVFLALAFASDNLGTGAVFYRGDFQRTGVFHTKGISANPEIKWKFKKKCYDSKFDSSPAIHNGVLYIGVTSSSSDCSHFYAVDLATGREIWDFDIDRPPTSAFVAEGRVFFGCRDKVFYALDASTGQLLWRMKADGEIHSSPIVKNGTVFFGSKGGTLYALDTITGREKWRFKSSAYSSRMDSSPAISGNTLVVGTNDVGSNSVYAFDITTGKKKWEYGLRGGFEPSNGNVAIYEDLVFVGDKKFHDSYLHVLDLKTGQLRWSHEIEGGSLTTSPAVNNGVVYFGSGNYLYAIKFDQKKTEKKNKGFLEKMLSSSPREPERKVGKIKANGWISSTPSIADGAIYLGSGNGFFYCLDEESGKLKWQFQWTNAGIWSSPVIVNGLVLFGSRDGILYALHEGGAAATDASASSSETVPGYEGMMNIPAGWFEMGCAVDDKNCDGDETPRRRIYMDSYWIDVREVTVAEYQKCVASGVCTDTFSRGGIPSECNWGYPDKSDSSMNCAIWSQARDYCSWRGKELPTEAQWEYAARGNDSRRRPWKYYRPAPDGRITNPQPGVPWSGRFLAGNVSEWCRDIDNCGVKANLQYFHWYKHMPEKNPYQSNPVHNVKGDDISKYVIRGGRGGEFRISDRDSLKPDTVSPRVGFRCVKAN